jgi:hypothetical protein
MWSKQSAKHKQPNEQKAANLKKHEKDIAAYCVNAKSEARKKVLGGTTDSQKSEQGG